MCLVVYMCEHVCVRHEVSGAAGQAGVGRRGAKESEEAIFHFQVFGLWPAPATQLSHSDSRLTARLRLGIRCVSHVHLRPHALEIFGRIKVSAGFGKQ